MDLILRPAARVETLTLSDKVLLSAFFLLATALGAFVAIPLPFTPVPVTLQTLFVLLTGAYLGRGWGSGVQATYLLAGGVGAPFFAAGAAGAAALGGPTAGYLVGFVPAAWFVGWLLPKARTYPARLAVFLAASLFILVPGTGWLAASLGLTPAAALVMGFLPFLAGDVLKCALAALAAPRR